MDQAKKDAIENLYESTADNSGAEHSQPANNSLGKPVRKSKWPVAIILMIVFLLLIIAAIITGFLIFL